MRVHEHVELILLRYPKYLDGERDPLLIIHARASMLDGLPGKDISNSIVSQVPEPLKVSVGVLKRERPPNKGHIISVEELVWLIRGDIWCLGVFGVPCHINPSKDNFSPLGVSEGLSVDVKVEGAHSDGGLEGQGGVRC